MNVENFNHVYHFWREQTNYKHFSFKNLINDQVLNDSVNRVLYELFQLRISIIFFEKNNIFKYHFFHDIRNCIGNFSWMNYHKRGTIKASITTQYKWWNISILILKNAKKTENNGFFPFFHNTHFQKWKNFWVLCARFCSIVVIPNIYLNRVETQYYWLKLKKSPGSEEVLWSNHQ